ncbi:MAG: polyphenol oxidase family protein [Spirochaetota bacterium]
MIFRQIETAAGQVTICFTGTDRDLVADSFTQVYRNIRQKLDNRSALVWAEQVHGNSVLVCEEPVETISCLGEGDAIIARSAGIAPLVRTADCIPILVYAENSPLVAAVHAGWRGLQKQVFSQALFTVLGNGTKIADLRFVVGPFIRENSYEVGAEVAGQFAAGFSSPTADGKFLLNLKGILQSEMDGHGILPQQVTWFDADTLSSPEWFSARRGEQGRNMALVFYSA